MKEALSNAGRGYTIGVKRERKRFGRVEKKLLVEIVVTVETRDGEKRWLLGLGEEVYKWVVGFLGMSWSLCTSFHAGMDVM